MSEQHHATGSGSSSGHKTRPRLFRDGQVKALKPEPKVYDQACGAVDGLLIRVTPLNRRGVSRKMWLQKLGDFPAMKLADAQQQALDRRAVFLRGENPWPDDDGVKKRYLDVYVNSAGKYGGAKSPHGVKCDKSTIKNHVPTAFRQKRIVDVRKSDVQALLATASRGMGRKIKNLLGVLFKHAEEEEIIAFGKSPVRGIKLAPERKMN